MDITYLDSDGVLLGKTDFTNFDEILVPSYTGGYNPYLILQFTSSNIYHWKILDLTIKANQVQIILEPMPNNPKSINAIAMGVRSTPKRFLTEFSLVEVEFGFFSSVLNQNETLSRNNIYSNALLNGEIHKKRPCIVLKTFEHSAQIIPLTSKVGKINPRVDIPINIDKVNGVSTHYHIPTFALVEMIQTVSYDRIFPPRGDDGKFHDKPYPILTTDKDALKVGLASLYNAGIQTRVDNIQRNLTKTTQEKFRILEKNKQIISERTKLFEDLNTQIMYVGKLEETLLNAGQSLGLGTDLAFIVKELDKLK